MWRSRPVRAACLAATFVLCSQPGSALGYQVELADHASHSPVTHEERALRELLARYRNGDVEGAVRDLLATPRDRSRAALDACLQRIDEHIKYHRRPQNRLSAGGDERLERFMRADRLHVLQLTAALLLDASRAVADVDTVGALVVESERTVELMHGLQRDFEANGPVPWPPGSDDQVDWPAVGAFVSRWYPAAISRLQQLVELRLAPALVARGLARFPGHADLLLARGSFVETRLALSRVDASLAPDLYPPDTRQRWREELSEAESDLARAAETAGSASEAAVRLARVRLLRGQAERARDLLDRVLSGAAPVEIRYLALLFRAAAAEESGNVLDATRDYRAAVALVPGARTPMLALGRIADEQQQETESRTWVARALAPSTGTPDPWRRYIQGQAWQIDTRMARLRNLVPQ